jgi:hypothetical protein
VGLRCYSLAAGKGVMARCEILSSGGFAGGVTLDVMVAEGQLMELMIAYQAGDLGAFGAVAGPTLDIRNCTQRVGAQSAGAAFGAREQ